MNFIGTRGGSKVTGARAIINGLAEGGGLFVPENFPLVQREELEGMLATGYPERAAEILFKFFDEYGKEELKAACVKAFSHFDGGDPAPLVRVDDGVYMLELWHGPTLSLSDMSMAIMPYLISEGCKKEGIKQQLLLLAPAAGDVAKAALQAFNGAEGVKVMVIYPAEGISKMQKLHVCTQEGKNLNVLALRGGLDDCNALVRHMLTDPAVTEEFAKAGVALCNLDSANIGRIVPQIAAYFSGYLDLVSGGQIEMGEEIDFTLPVGTFGTALAGLYAKKMGLPIRRIHCASNLNCTMFDFFKTGAYDVVRELYKTTSPSMDILNPTNAERLIFEVSGRDAKLTAARMQALETDKKFLISSAELDEICRTFDGGTASEETSVEAMYGVFEDVGYTMDPHTGCAMKVALDWFEKNKKDKTNMIIISTANPYKYPQDVLYAVTGNDVKDSFKGVKRLHAATAMAVPKQLTALRDKPLRFTGSADAKKAVAEALQFAKS